ncbi:hypothetical protein ID867_16685 [Streptomyces parvulus]|nr:hypothetical protein [Streptomyces parvulus]
MLDEVAHACPPSAAPEAPPTGPAEPSTPGPGETPPSDPIEPLAPTEGPEVELNARDWCAGVRHEQRIAEALWDLTDPTPTEVRTVLNDLGYIDERIHGLERSGTTTRFSLDLRDRGGRLCLNGSAAGEQTVVDMCVPPRPARSHPQSSPPTRARHLSRSGRTTPARDGPGPPTVCCPKSLSPGQTDRATTRPGSRWRRITARYDPHIRRQHSGADLVSRC